MSRLEQGYGELQYVICPFFRWGTRVRGVCTGMRCGKNNQSPRDFNREEHHKPGLEIEQPLFQSRSSNGALRLRNLDLTPQPPSAAAAWRSGLPRRRRLRESCLHAARGSRTPAGSPRDRTAIRAAVRAAVLEPLAIEPSAAPSAAHAPAATAAAVAAVAAKRHAQRYRGGPARAAAVVTAVAVTAHLLRRVTGGARPRPRPRQGALKQGRRSERGRGRHNGRVREVKPGRRGSVVR